MSTTMDEAEVQAALRQYNDAFERDGLRARMCWSQQEYPDGEFWSVPRLEVVRFQNATPHLIEHAFIQTRFRDERIWFSASEESIVRALWELTTWATIGDRSASLDWVAGRSGATRVWGWKTVLDLQSGRRVRLARFRMSDGTGHIDTLVEANEGNWSLEKRLFHCHALLHGVDE